MKIEHIINEEAPRKLTQWERHLLFSFPSSPFGVARDGADGRLFLLFPDREIEIYRSLFFFIEPGELHYLAGLMSSGIEGEKKRRRRKT